MEKLGAFLGAADYVVIVTSLITCSAVGCYHKYRQGKNPKIEEYFLGGRQMAVLPIAISMLATSLSSVPIVSGIAEMYRHGMEYIFLTIGLQFGKIIAAYAIIPVFRYLEYVSIYEYFERRFDRSVRLGFSVAYIMMNVFQASVVLYLPTLLLTIVTGLPYWLTASVSGAVCTIYCIIGGFRTVVWTDVIQFSLMLLSLIAIIWCGTVAANGPDVVWKISFLDVLFKRITWVDSLDKRFTVISSVIFGTFMSLQQYATNQAVLQRILSVNSTKAAQRSVFITAFGGLLFCSLLVGCSGVIYANFYTCDPMQRPLDTGVKSLDHVLLYFVQRFLSEYPGLAGVVMAGILSSSLSTISSFINSFAVITLEDFIRPTLLKKNVSEKKAIFISKSITAVYGIGVTLFSFAIPLMGGALKALVSLIGAIGGPLAGLLFLAMFVRRAEKRACILAMFCGIGFCLWLSIGSSFYRMPKQTLPLSVESCPNSTVYVEFHRNATVLRDKLHTLPPQRSNRNIFPLYKIPFVWYGPLGITLTLIIGILLSYIQRDNSHLVDPRLLSPLVKRWIKPNPTPISNEVEGFTLTAKLNCRQEETLLNQNV